MAVPKSLQLVALSGSDQPSPSPVARLSAASGAALATGIALLFGLLGAAAARRPR